MTHRRIRSKQGSIIMNRSIILLLCLATSLPGCAISDAPYRDLTPVQDSYPSEHDTRIMTRDPDLSESGPSRFVYMWIAEEYRDSNESYEDARYIFVNM